MTLLESHNWGQEWADIAKKRKSAPDAKHWNERSKDFPRSAKPNSYVKAFLKYSAIGENESVFDMGCGNGALAIPLGLAGHEVLAADFSTGMLGALKEEASTLGNLPIKTLQMSWEDDWEEFGVKRNSFDVALASRSICTDDLADSIAKLDAVAKRRCAITLPVGPSPRIDRRILQEIGMPVRQGLTYEYAFLILSQMKRLAEVRYIESSKPSVFNSENDAIEAIGRMVSDACSELGCSEKESYYQKQAATWTRKHLMANPDAGSINEWGEVAGDVILDGSRKVTWAYIAWNVE